MSKDRKEMTWEESEQHCVALEAAAKERNDLRRSGEADVLEKALASGDFRTVANAIAGVK